MFGSPAPLQLLLRDTGPDAPYLNSRPVLSRHCAQGRRLRGSPLARLAPPRPRHFLCMPPLQCSSALLPLPTNFPGSSVQAVRPWVLWSPPGRWRDREGALRWEAGGRRQGAQGGEPCAARCSAYLGPCPQSQGIRPCERCPHLWGCGPGPGPGAGAGLGPACHWRLHGQRGRVRGRSSRGRQVEVWPESLQGLLGLKESEGEGESQWAEEDDTTVLYESTTPYNFIQVLEVARWSTHPLAGARLLLLDKPGNIHSIYFPYKAWTESYYDRFAALPPLLPPGPIAILGLAAGSAARAINYAWPNVQMVGWEIDPEVVQVARSFFDLGELEEASALGQLQSPGNGASPASSERHQPLMGRQAQRKGRLRVVVGDALRMEEGDTWDAENAAPREGLTAAAAGCSSTRRGSLSHGRTRNGSTAGSAAGSEGGIEVRLQERRKESEKGGVERGTREGVRGEAGGGGRGRGYLGKREKGDSVGKGKGGGSCASSFAGLVVDLFADGAVIPQLQSVATWQHLRCRLMEGGRVMVNCGGGCVESQSDSVDGERVMWATLAALQAATPASETLLCRRLDSAEDGNVMALTVRDPSDLRAWLDCRLPAQAVDSLDDWIPFQDFLPTCPPHIVAHLKSEGLLPE